MTSATSQSQIFVGSLVVTDRNSHPASDRANSWEVTQVAQQSSGSVRIKWRSAPITWADDSFESWSPSVGQVSAGFERRTHQPVLQRFKLVASKSPAN